MGELSPMASDGRHLAEQRECGHPAASEATVLGTAADEVSDAVLGPSVSVVGLVFDQASRVLVLTTGMAGRVELPGGLLDAHEGPEDALARVLRQRLGLVVPVGRLLAVDSLPTGANGRAGLVHLHTIGPLTAEQAATVQVSNGQVTAEWLTPDAACARLPEKTAARVRAAVSAWHGGGVAHLRGGEVQPGSPSGLSPERRGELEETHVDYSSFIAARPKAVVSAGVLCTDPEGRVLLVKPTYCDDGLWRAPGGGVESDLGETPRQAAHRELIEELGWCPPLGRLLGVNWFDNRPHPIGIAFTYDGGRITERAV